ncbi:MAG: hypothetical protein ACD_51C00047G0006 [uncultured bacterium]|nr:MAG: hypothetical protein ACD_51C00047G0006 [uncultured bacterium]
MLLLKREPKQKISRKQRVTRKKLKKSVFSSGIQSHFRYHLDLDKTKSCTNIVSAL